MRRLLWVLLLAATLVLAGCFGEEEGDPAGFKSSPSCGYPSAPEGPVAAVHVAASCLGPKTDGTAENPYATISSALSNTQGPATVLVAPGIYEESVRIERASVAVEPGGTVDSQDGQRQSGQPRSGFVTCERGSSLLRRWSAHDRRKGIFIGFEGSEKVILSVIVRILVPGVGLLGRFSKERRVEDGEAEWRRWLRLEGVQSTPSALVKPVAYRVEDECQSAFNRARAARTQQRIDHLVGLVHGLLQIDALGIILGEQHQ